MDNQPAHINHGHGTSPAHGHGHTNNTDQPRTAGSGAPGVDLGDDQVFARIWKSQKQSLYWLAVRILEERQEAQDVVTEAFVQLHQRAAATADTGKTPMYFASEEAVKGWLRVTVRNKALTRAEQQHYQRHRLTELGRLFHDIETQWYQEDVLARLLTRLYEEIEALPPKRREIFKLRFLSQLSNEEIAERLGIEHQSVRNHLVKALKALRLSMGQYSHLLGVLLALLPVRD